MTTDLFTKEEARAWFTDAVQKLELGSEARAQAWDHAWRAHEAQGADTQRWKGWVRMMVQRALSRSKTNPTGLFLKILQDPPDDLERAPEPPAPPPPVHRVGQPPPPQSYFDELRARRTAPPEPHPPMYWTCLANRTLGLPRGTELVRDEWDRQGRPYPNDFDPRPIQEQLRCPSGETPD